jgi:hypothetical protein
MNVRDCSLAVESGCAAFHQNFKQTFCFSPLWSAFAPGCTRSNLNKITGFWGGAQPQQKRF